jgi:hypothetical protein
MRRLSAWLLLLLLLGAVVISGHFLKAHDWEWGRQRSLLVLLLGASAFFARSPAGRLELRARPLVAALWLLALGLTGRDLITGVESVRRAASTGEIRLDQGQNTLRAGRLLRRGQDPYARWQLLDLEAYSTRLHQRDAAGLHVGLEPRALRFHVDRWWRELDDASRLRLLPPAEAPAARAEGALYGYKYGPLLPLVTAAVDARLGAASVPLLQLVLYLGWLALLVLSLHAAGVESGAIPLGLIALSLEPSAARNYLELSASDVWVLAASAGAVLAFLRQRPVWLGLCAAAALGCKAFPAALLLPLLFVRPSRASFLGLGGGLLAIYGPFLWWDPAGLWANLVRWPSAMAPDNTGWVWYATPPVSAAARAILLFVLAGFSAWFVHSRHSAPASSTLPFGFLALGSALAILAGAAFHGNYVPWVTSWAVCAVLAAFFGGTADVSASAQAPSVSTKK